MCGLAGFAPATPRPPEELLQVVGEMASALAHRGPDDEGTWAHPSGRIALAFRRLAIIDLSPAGHQPMTSSSGRYTIVFNGEVYNHRALRSELGDIGWRGESDTEVLVEAVDRWGLEATLPRLVGMFAMALWDERETTLWLVRDRMGIKPLYVGQTARGIWFGSELAALLRAPGFDSGLDLGALGSFLQYLYFPGPQTPLASVAKLEPGHLLEIPLGRGGDSQLPAPRPWWSLESVARKAEAVVRSSGTSGASDPEPFSHVDRLSELLEDAVALRMVADVPVGALLSGGIDSSLVVALMQHQSAQPVRTFTIGFDDPAHDESAHARAVASHLSTHHTEMAVSGRDALDLVPRIPEIFDEPLADPSQIPTYLVSALARRDVIVTLTGDGGDELFAGYNRHAQGLRLLPRVARIPRVPRAWLGRLVHAVPDEVWNAADRLSARNGGELRLASSKAEKLGQLMLADSPAEMYRSLLSSRNDASRLLPLGPTGTDPVRAGLPMPGRPIRLSDMLLSDQRSYLPDDLLQKVDRASMAVGMEVRVPLLDHRVVEFSWTLPDHLKIRDGVGKWALRQILYRHVPKELVDRPKTGFTVPLEQWLKGPLRDWAEYLLLDPDPVRDRLFRSEVVRRSWHAFVSGRPNQGLGLWALLTFESWRRHWRLDSFQGER